MTTAICPGSYDPITLGHLDIIRRSAKIFDKVIVLVLINPGKEPCFSAEERMDFISRATADLDNVVSDFSNGLLVDYTKSINSPVVIVKGLRAVSDFEYEFQQALINKKLSGDLETFFLSCASEYMYLSSSMVRQLATQGRDISEFVPSVVSKDIISKLS